MNKRLHINLTGVWYTFRNGERETILLEDNVDTLTITWKANDVSSRELDWSWGRYENEFTLAGGYSQKILRWRPLVRGGWVKIYNTHTRARAHTHRGYLKNSRNDVVFTDDNITRLCLSRWTKVSAHLTLTAYFISD